MLSSIATSALDFIKVNIFKLIVALVLIAIFYLIFYATTTSLKKLKTDILPSYPFDLFFPHAGGWSIGYFLIVIIALGLLIFFLGRGGFYLGPA